MDYVENVTTSSPNIKSITVENSSNVALGNKTFFNGPVITENLIIAKGRDDSFDTLAQSERPFIHRIRNVLRKHRFFVCSIFMAVAVIVITSVLVASLSDIFSK